MSIRSCFCGPSNSALPGLLVLMALGAVVLSGCEVRQPVHFRLNLEGQPRTGSTGEETKLLAEQRQQMVDVLDGLFGQPDRPYVHDYAREDETLDFELIALASGPTNEERTLLVTKDQQVYTGQVMQETAESIFFEDAELGLKEFAAEDVADRFRQMGLYRKHCVHCHGVSGDGNGPTAPFLNPYPRDFRTHGYKFISTEVGKPSREDLKRTLVEGIPGTSMPSFKLLAEEDLDALVEYVRYLSVRGSYETLLPQLVQLEADDPSKLDQDYEIIVEIVLDEVLFPWRDAEDPAFTLVPDPKPADIPLQESIARGRELFYSKKANCVGCHGDAAQGDGLSEPHYDLWNKEKLAGDPHLFSLPLQDLKPRNLRTGVLRGGRRPVDLYRRIRLGIMPSQMPSATALTPEEIWSLVDFIQALPYEEKAARDALQETAGRPRL